jgi:hypothetical protein
MKSDTKEEKKEKGNTIKTTIIIRRDLWKRMKHKAIDTEKSIEEMLEMAVEQFLTKQ